MINKIFNSTMEKNQKSITLSLITPKFHNEINHDKKKHKNEYDTLYFSLKRCKRLESSKAWSELTSRKTLREKYHICNAISVDNAFLLYFSLFFMNFSRVTTSAYECVRIYVLRFKALLFWDLIIAAIWYIRWEVFSWVCDA